MQPDSLDKLRAHIRKIEKKTSSFAGSQDIALKEKHDKKKSEPIPDWSLGAREVDQCFEGGLSSHALHQISPAHYQDSWAALSFALALLSCRTQHGEKPILWCASSRNMAEFGGLYGHGLQRFNLDPGHFIFIETKNDKETAFVLEEALKSGRLSGIIGLIPALGFTPSRRLSLMAVKGNTPALLVTSPNDTGINSATTRWQIARSALDKSPLAPSLSYQFGWQVTLTHNRQGPADKTWHLEFPFYEPPLGNSSKKAFRFCHPSPFRNRKSDPRETKAA